MSEEMETWRAGNSGGQDLLDAALVGGVRVAVEEADGHGVCACLQQLSRLIPHGLLVQLHEDRGVVIGALGDLSAQMAGRKRGRVLDVQVVDVEADLPPDLQGVAEALGGEKADHGALALDKGVGHQGSAVDDLLDRLRGGWCGAEAVGREPSRAPTEGSPGVVGYFSTAIRPSLTSTKSVKVPPTSMPIRVPTLRRLLMSVCASSASPRGRPAPVGPGESAPVKIGVADRANGLRPRVGPMLLPASGGGKPPWRSASRG